MVPDYETHAERFRLNWRQKIQFLSMIFQGDSRKFFKNKVNNLKAWGEAMLVLNERCNSEAKMCKIIDEVGEFSIGD